MKFFRDYKKIILTGFFTTIIGAPAFGSVECVIAQTKGLVHKTDKIPFQKGEFIFPLEDNEHEIKFQRYNGSFSIATTQRANDHAIAAMNFFLSYGDLFVDQTLIVPSVGVSVTCSGSL